MESVVRLIERPDWREASALADELRSRRGAAVTIDASQPISVSALVIEVLVAAAKQWRLDGHPFRIVDRSAPFDETCRTLGFEPGNLVQMAQDCP